MTPPPPDEKSLAPRGADGHAPATAHRHVNRLARESSPYLLQHAHNPVDWYPWGDEAFEKARREDKPVFLSIGYSTCHWCHVMERESFESERVAAVLNEKFVCVKVDREERPDVDATYMAAVQALGGRGGWPLSAWLTADRQAFYGGTYFPPEDRYGRPGFVTVLNRLHELWTNERPRLVQQAAQLTEHIRARSRPPAGETLAEDVLDLALRQFQGTYDHRHGGFGTAPKFPRAFSLWLLMRRRDKGPGGSALDPQIRGTLNAMALGGIHDHLGGGFHRYSTDAEWLLPHFEKMLYDQALLARAYSAAAVVYDKPRYAAVARDTLDYVLRDLRDAAGGFHSAEDADSEGVEGKFYVWTRAELVEALGDEDGSLLAGVYRAIDEGNHVDEATHRRNGTNILHLDRTLAEHAERRGADPAAFAARVATLRKRLLAVRAKRIRPHLDDKVLVDWNGLMIGAFAYAGRVLGEPRYVQAAREAADFVLREMWDGTRLLHRFRTDSRGRSEKGIDGFLDDYAFLAHGLTELHQTTQDPRYLEVAGALLHRLTERFADDAGGGWLLAEPAEDTLVRTKELYDGAIPSGNSVALHELVRVGRLVGDERLRRAAREGFDAWAGTIRRYPMGHPFALLAFDLELGPAREIVVAGDPRADDTQALLAAAQRLRGPRDVVLLHDPGPGGAALRESAPFLAGRGAVDGKAAAWVCTEQECRAPVTTVEALASLLRAGKAPKSPPSSD